MISRHDHFKFEEETLHIKFIPHSDDQHVVALEPSSAQYKWYMYTITSVMQDLYGASLSSRL